MYYATLSMSVLRAWQVQRSLTLDLPLVTAREIVTWRIFRINRVSVVIYRVTLQMIFRATLNEHSYRI